MNSSRPASVRDDGTPIYRQIERQIREDIVSGALGPDERVMSTNEYAAFHRINPATAAKALQRLVEAGVLYKRRGLGMYVSPDAPTRLRDERRATFIDDQLAPVLAEARRLGLSTDDVVDAIRFHDARQGVTT